MGNGIQIKICLAVWAYLLALKVDTGENFVLSGEKDTCLANDELMNKAEPLLCPGILNVRMKILVYLRMLICKVEQVHNLR